MPIKRSYRTCSKAVIADVWKREVGDLSSRNFTRLRAASEDLVLRLDVLQKLDKHRGCVNTVSFNEAGDILVSGSDDREIIFWDWETGKIRLSFHSGHHNNVFQAKIMPYSEDRSIISCAADGQVRHAQVRESGAETKLLARHSGRVHKLAIEPGSPHIFYSCGEDGLVQHIDLRTERASRLFYCVPLLNRSYYNPVHLNAIAIDPRNPNLFAVGGSDQFARLFDIRKYNWEGSCESGQPVDFFCPPHLLDDEQVEITGLAFSDQRELLVSYNDEFIYLFSKDIGLGPDPSLASHELEGSDRACVTPDDSSGVSTLNSHSDVKAALQCYKGHRNSETVKGVNFFGPRCEYVLSGSDCGRIFIWKKNCGELLRVMEADAQIVNCIDCHPHATVLASSGIDHDIKVWTPKSICRATLPTNIHKDRVMCLFGDRGLFFPVDNITEDGDCDLSGSDDGDDSDGDESWESGSGGIDEYSSDDGRYYNENEEGAIEEEDAGGDIGVVGADVQLTRNEGEGNIIHAASDE